MYHFPVEKPPSDELVAMHEDDQRSLTRGRMRTRVQPVLTSPLNRTLVVAPEFALRLSMAVTNSVMHSPWVMITT